MNPLLDPLESAVWIDGKRYRLNTDFRTSIQFEIAMLDPALPQEEKAWAALELYFDEIPDDLEAAMEAVTDFYRCGGEEARSGSGGDGDRVYSFAHDGKYIYAAFWQQYRIDLIREHLHWWQFRALFNALSSDTLFVKIMGWRSARIDAKTPPEDRDRLRKLKEQYALPVLRTENEKTEKIFNFLMNL